MGTLHARDRADRPAHLIQEHATRHALQQDVRRIAQQNPGPREHPKADSDRDDRIDPGHTGEANGYRPGDDPDLAEHVSPDFEICAFEIEAPLLAGPQQAPRHQIDYPTGYRDGDRESTRLTSSH